MIRRYLTGAAVAVLCVASTAGRTQVTSYSSLSAWQTRAAQTNIFTFEGIVGPFGEVDNPTLTPLTVTLQGGDDPGIYVYGGSDIGGHFSLNGTSDLVTGLSHTSPATVTIQLGSTVTAVASDFGFLSAFGTGPDTDSAMVQLYNGATPVGSAFDTGSLSDGFFGATSPIGFDRFTVTTDNLGEDYQAFDNIRVGSSTPEPGAFALLAGLGVAATGLLRRRRNPTR